MLTTSIKLDFVEFNILEIHIFNIIYNSNKLMTNVLGYAFLVCSLTFFMGRGWGLLLSGGRNFHKGSAINLKNYSTIAELSTVARSHIILLWGPLLSEFSQVHY